MNDEYIRYAKVVRVVDGDTVVFDVDLGFRMTTRQTTRLAGINAPEMTGVSKPQGVAAKEFLEKLLPVGQNVAVQTYKLPFDKYGRFLAVVYLPEHTISINDLMINNGHAVIALY